MSGRTKQFPDALTEEQISADDHVLFADASDSKAAKKTKASGIVAFLNDYFINKANTDEFTPTEDYHPATKKYADENGGVSVHSELSNLDFASSGHTGFLPDTHLTDFDHSLIASALQSESDPVFTSSPAYGIESDDISNWDAAYGWGDHSLAGYLTAETDPVFTAWDKSTGISITESQISDFQSYYKLDQTAPQDIVPYAGTTFGVTYFDVLPSFPGALLVPALAFTNSNVVPGVSPYYGAIRGGLFTYAYDGYDASIILAHDAELDQVATFSYDSTNNWLDLTVGSSGAEFRFFNGDNGTGTYFPVLGGTASDASNIVVLDTFLGIWDSQNTGGIIIAAVSQDFSQTSYVLVWTAATEQLTYGGSGGFVVSIDGNTNGTTAEALGLNFKALGQGHDNDGVRLKFGHRTDSGLFGQGYVAGYVDCVQTDATNLSQTSYLSFGGYTSGSSAEWLRLTGTSADFQSLSIETTGACSFGSGTTIGTADDYWVFETVSYGGAYIPVMRPVSSWAGADTGMVGNFFNVWAYSVASPGWNLYSNDFSEYVSGVFTPTLDNFYMRYYASSTEHKFFDYTYGTGVSIGDITGGNYFTVVNADFGVLGSFPVMVSENTDFALGTNIGALADFLIIYDYSDAGSTVLAFASNSLGAVATITCDHSTTTFYVDTDWCPVTDNTWNIGSASYRYYDGFFSNSIVIGSTALDESDLISLLALL